MDIIFSLICTFRVDPAVRLERMIDYLRLTRCIDCAHSVCFIINLSNVLPMNFELVLYGLGLSSFLIVWPITDLVHLVNSSLDARWAKISDQERDGNLDHCEILIFYSYLSAVWSFEHFYMYFAARQVHH